MKERKLGLRKKPSGYWITGLPVYYADGDGPFTECGPYETKLEAQSSLNGMTNTLNEMGWEDEERPQEGKKAKPGTSSRKVVSVKTFSEEIVQANAKRATKVPVKKAAPKPKAIKTSGLW